MILSKSAVRDSKKLLFIKKQEGSGLLSSLKSTLSKVKAFLTFCYRYKKNKIVNKFLLAGDKFMPEMHLGQPVFIFSACGYFTENKNRIKKFKETRDSTFIYQNILFFCTL